MAVPVLNIPAQDLSRRPKPYLKTRYLQSWMDGLPVDDTLPCTDLLIEQLTTINRSSYPAVERLHLMETLRPLAQELVKKLKLLLGSERLPLSEEQKRAMQTLHQLLDEMATGYKCVVSQMSIENYNLRKESEEMMLCEAIYHSILYMARRLVESYLSYAPEPDEVWLELHQLYDYAFQSEIHDIAIDDPYPESNVPFSYTIEHIYKRIILLSMANPYHLMKNEAEDLYYFLSLLCEDCLIEPAIAQNIDEQFVIDMMTDLPPRYLTADHDWIPNNARSLDITAVRLRLDNIIQPLLSRDFFDDTQSSVDARQRDTLIRLAQSLEGNFSRQSDRHFVDNDVRIAIGLNAAHCFISDVNAENSALQVPIKQNSAPGKSAGLYQIIASHPQHNARHHSTYHWKQHNASASGIALHFSLESQDHNINVGELVSYRVEQQEDSRWNIGMIRWLKHQENASTDIGIMNLAQSAIPVLVKASSGIGRGTAHSRGIMIPKMLSTSQTRSLIVPPRLYDIDTVLTVEIRQRTFRIRLTRQYLSTNSFTQYDFVTLDH